MLMNNIQVFMNLMKQASGIQRNPSMLADILFQRGAVDRQTYDQIRGKSPSQIGEYLMNNGMMDQNQAKDIYQAATQIR